MENENRRGMGTFVVIWSGQLVSTIGSGLTGFVMGVWLFEETRSTTLFALNMLAYMLPNVLLSPLIGALVDRLDRRLIMILSDTGAGLSTAAVALLHLSGNLEVWHVYVATFFNAAFSSFQWPAYSAATTLLVPKRHLGRASGMVQIGEAVSQLISPAIAGALFVSIGLGRVLLIDFATFAFAVLSLLAVRIPRPEVSAESEAARGSLLKEGLFGWAYIKARPGLLGLLLYFASWNLFWGLGNVALFPMVLALSGPEKLGYLVSIVGVGMLLGTLAMSVWGGPKRRVIGVIGAGLLGSLMVVVVGMSTSLLLITIGMFGFMLTSPIGNGSSQALWQSKVEPDVQGRVFAVRRMVAWSTSPIAYLVAGPLVDRVFTPLMVEGGALASLLGPIIGVGPGRGQGLLIILVGVLIFLSSLIAYSYTPLRRVDTDLPDAVGEGAPDAEAEDVPGAVAAPGAAASSS